MTDQNPIRTDARRRRRQERLGSPNPKCVLCGRPDLETLTPVSHVWLKAQGIELHHVVAEQRDAEFVVALCLNCHRLVTEKLAQAGVGMVREPDPAERVASMLDGLAVFFQHLVEALGRWAADLRNSVKGDVSE